MYTESGTTRVSPLYAKSVNANGLFILVVKRTFVTGWFCGPVFVPNSHSAPGYVDQVKAITVGGVSTDIWLIPQPLTYIAREYYLQNRREKDLEFLVQWIGQPVCVLNGLYYIF